MANNNNNNANVVNYITTSHYGGDKIRGRRDKLFTDLISDNQHRHELSAKERALGEKVIYEQILSWINASNQGRGKILDIGGNPRRHHDLGRNNVWCLCPELSPSDSVRIAQSNKDGLDKFCNCKWENWDSNNGYCCPQSQRFFNGHKPVAIMMIHSIYYISQEQVLRMTTSVQCPVPVYSLHYEFRQVKDTLYDGECSYIRSSDGHVQMQTEGNNVLYTHRNTDWIWRTNYFSDTTKAMAWSHFRTMGTQTSPTVVCMIVKSALGLSTGNPTFQDPFMDPYHFGPIDLRRKVGETKEAMAVVWKALPNEYLYHHCDTVFSFGSWLLLGKFGMSNIPTCLSKQSICEVSFKMTGVKRDSKSFLVAIQYAKAALERENLTPLQKQEMVPVVAALGFTVGVKEETIAATYAITYNTSLYWSWSTWIYSYFTQVPVYSLARLNELYDFQVPAKRTDWFFYMLLLFVFVVIYTGLSIFGSYSYHILFLLLGFKSKTRYVAVLLLAYAMMSGASAMDNEIDPVDYQNYVFMIYRICFTIALTSFISMYYLVDICDQPNTCLEVMGNICSSIVQKMMYFMFLFYCTHFRTRKEIYISLLLIYIAYRNGVFAMDDNQHDYDPYSYLSYFISFILSLFWRYHIFEPRFRVFQDVCVQGSDFSKIAIGAGYQLLRDYDEPCSGKDCMILAGPTNGPPPNMARSCIHNELRSIINRAIKEQVNPEPGFWHRACQRFRSTDLYKTLVGQRVQWVSFEDWVNRFPGAKRRNLMKAYEELRSDGYGVGSKDAYKTFIKREHVLKYPFDPRTIQGTSLRYQIYTGPEVYAISKHLSKCFSSNNYCTPISVTYSSGLTAEALGAWFQKQVDDGLTWSIEADVSRWDAAVCDEALDVEFTIYREMLIRQVTLEYLEEQHKTVGYTRHGIKYFCRATRKSGTNNTSVGNSLLNIIKSVNDVIEALAIVFKQYGRRARVALIVMGDDIVICSDYITCNVIFDVITKNSPKYGMKTDVLLTQRPEYCSGCFWPVAGTYVFGPKPGRILAKCFYLRRSNITRKGVLAHLKGLLICLNLNVYFIPIVRVVFKKLLYLLRFVEATPMNEFIRHTAMLKHECDASTIHFFCERYDTTLTIIQLFEAWIEKQTTLFFALDSAPSPCGELAIKMRKIDTK